MFHLGEQKSLKLLWFTETTELLQCAYKPIDLMEYNGTDIYCRNRMVELWIVW